MVHGIFTTAEWSRLLSQVGYGNPVAPLWFLGMEEGLDEGEAPDKGDLNESRVSTLENLKWRLKHFEQPFDSITNHLQAPWIKKDAHGTPILPKTHTWRIMAKIARKLAGAQDWEDRDKARNYVQTQLGIANGSTLLLELLPLPKPGVEAWPQIYNECVPGGLKAYQDEMLPTRIIRLRKLVEGHEPANIICYGKENWPYYEEIFSGANWEERQLGTGTNVRTWASGSTNVVLTPFFVPFVLPVAALADLCELLKAV